MSKSPVQKIDARAPPRGTPASYEAAFTMASILSSCCALIEADSSKTPRAVRAHDALVMPSIYIIRGAAFWGETHVQLFQVSQHGVRQPKPDPFCPKSRFLVTLVVPVPVNALYSYNQRTNARTETGMEVVAPGLECMAPGGRTWNLLIVQR